MKSAETALEPELEIVDAHHHLYKRAESTYLFDDLLSDLSCGHRVVSTVFVDSHAMYRSDGRSEFRCIGETEFANGIAAMSASGLYGSARACAGIVSSAKLEMGAGVREVLEAHVRAGNGRFRGVRRNSAWDPDPAIHRDTRRGPGLLLDTGFREGFAQISRLGLSFDAFLYHPQLPELIDLAHAFPDTPICINHCGAPLGIGAYAMRANEGFAEWRSSMAALSGCRNVTVKLGGLGMRLTGLSRSRQPGPVPSEMLAAEWRAHMETCIELFGASRCMFESNFPVDRDASDYSVVWNAFKRITAGCSVAERADLFSGTARRFYRLDPPAV